MADAQACAGRVARFRDLMARMGYDAAIVRNNADLRWLTGSERTFDDEVAHTAFITADGLWLHTDSRYYGIFLDRMGKETPWQIDEDVIDPTQWAADHARDARSRVVAVEDTCDLAFFDAFGAACLADGVECLTPRMHGFIADLRMVKDDEELSLLQRAQDITDDAFRHIVEYIKPGLTEQQVRAELDNYMLTHGADNVSFETIIAAGPNGANPHARPSEYVLREGDMVVMDYGALYHDYHADMTRTVCVGKAGEEQRRVYDVVRRTNEECQTAAHGGVNGLDMQNLAVKIISDAGYGEYFGHGLGHGVGLQIHENPGFSRHYDRVVPSGSIVTIEPGIYLPGKFGVRVEDCGVVAEDGYHPFSKIPHDLVEIPC